MNHLFPAKVIALLNNIKSMSSYSKLVENSKALTLPFPTDQDRINLTTPAIRNIVAAEYDITNARVRLVMPDGAYRSDQTIIEVYNMNGEKIKMMPLAVDEMSVTLGLALETELLYLLATSKEIEIPMM